MSNNPMNFDERPIRQLVAEAHEIALKYNHEYVTIEHLLAASINDELTREILEELSNVYAEMIISLSDYLGSGEIPVGRGHPRQTKVAVSVIQNTIRRAMGSGRMSIEPIDVVISILDMGNSQAAYILETYDVTALAIKTQISKIRRFKDELAPVTEGGVEAKQAPKTGKKTGAKQAIMALEQFTTNLNDLVKEGKIDELIGRKTEVYKISKILCRRNKNNVILVGEPGVGKTAIAEGLAYRIVNNLVADPLKAGVVYSLDVGALMAGTRYRGDLEERLQAIIQGFIIIAEEKNIKPIFFIDEIHTIVGAGAGGEGKALDIANLLKPALQKGYLRAIGATTHAEYRKHFEKDGALRRRFQRVIVDEPSIDETIEIIKGLRPYYEEFHGIQLTDEAIEKAVNLSVQYIHTNHLPDKALDVIDSAGARNRIVDSSEQVQILDVAQITTEVAELANVPVDKLNASKEEELKILEPNLKMKLFGQDDAIEAVVSSILIARAGMRDPLKPEGAFLFNGPTGVGKTELCKLLASQLEMHFQRFDMSEYMEEHSVAKLIGAPPGYVGYDENGGLLINAVDAHPNALILFDEFEKAHPKVQNILLQVLDYGKLSNSQGKSVSFRNCIIVLSGNIGSALAERPSMGFSAAQNTNAQHEEVIKYFSPEFRNRLDAVITFNKLTPDICSLVLDKFINELNMQLAAKSIVLDLSDAGRDYLLKEGFDAKMGARPLARVIDQKIKKPLAPEMLFGKLKGGGKVIVDIVDNEVVFSFAEQKESITE